MFDKGIFRRLSMVLALILCSGVLSAIPASAIVYSNLESGEVGESKVDDNDVIDAEYITIPRDARTVRVSWNADDDRIKIDETSNGSFEVDTTSTGTHVYNRIVGSPSGLTIDHDDNSFLGGLVSWAPYTVDVVYVPQEPTITSITRNVDSLTAVVTFTPGINNGPIITNYKFSLDNGVTWNAVSPADTTSPITIYGLGDKGVYPVRILAVNENGDGIPSAAFNTGLTAATVVGSVGSVPYNQETGIAVANFAISLAGANENDSASTTFALTSQPSGSNASISLSNVNGQGTLASAPGLNPIVVDVTTSVFSGGFWIGNSTVTININNVGGLVPGNYVVTATPSAVMAQTGATVQRVTFAVGGRPTDGPRLESINAVADFANTGLVRDAQVVNVGARVQNNAGGVGTIRLRADLISTPAGAYVNTVAADGPTNFLSAPTPLTNSNSNLVTYVGNFNDCAPGDTSANCDSVTATAGTALVPAVAKATFSFTPTVAGTYTMRVWQDANNNGLLDVNEVRTDISVTVATFPLVSTTFSKSIVNVVAGAGIAPAAANAYASDQAVVAPKGTGAAATKVASIRVTLNSTASTLAGDVRMDGRATFPVVTASIAGPGLLAVSQAGGVANPTGRNVRYTITSAATDVVQNVFFIEVWNDGTNGASTVSIFLDGVEWQKETVSFYGAPSTVTVTQNLKVAPANTSAAFGCGAAACAGGSIAAIAPAVIVVKDSAGIAVPGATITATSSDTAVFSSTIASAETATAGTYNANITPVLGSTSGQSATLTYKATLGTDSASSSPVTFKVGGAAASATMSISANSQVGGKSSMTFSAKDAAGNAPFDAYHALALGSDTSLTSSLGAIGDMPLAGTVLLVDGSSGAISFFNPLVPANVTISGTLAGAAISGSFSVSNAAVDAAADAAAEAIDAANAATDAANLAAEAADAATVAAEEARDAADAATAAVEELATQVATLMAALKAQITTLANTVAKIAKKVKA